MLMQLKRFQAEIEHWFLGSVTTDSVSNMNDWNVQLLLNGSLKIDTGAETSIISKHTYDFVIGQSYSR